MAQSFSPNQKLVITGRLKDPFPTELNGIKFELGVGPAGIIQTHAKANAVYGFAPSARFPTVDEHHPMVVIQGIDSSQKDKVVSTFLDYVVKIVADDGKDWSQPDQTLFVRLA